MGKCIVYPHMSPRPRMKTARPGSTRAAKGYADEWVNVYQSTFSPGQHYGRRNPSRQRANVLAANSSRTVLYRIRIKWKWGAF